jgi:hypothetical protein
MPDFRTPDRQRAYPKWAWSMAAVVAVLVSGGALAAARAIWVRSQRPLVFEVPAGSTSQVAGPGGARIHLSGPGALALGSRRITLRSGSALVEAGSETVSVELGDVGVTVAPGAAARTSAEGENARVENVRGEVWLRPSASAEPAALSAGQSFFRGVVATAPPSVPNPPPLEITPQTPEEKVPAAVDVAPAPPARPRDPVESHLLGAALRKLRKESNPVGALELFDKYDRTFPHGNLAPEALVGRVEALMALGRKREALVILEGPLTQWRTSRSLQVLRGELRAASGRFEEAGRDFAGALSAEPHDALDERALFGRAVCRSRAGDKAGAREDLLLYESRFPNGQFASQVRSSLERR